MDPAPFQRSNIHIARLARTLICVASFCVVEQGCNSSKSATQDAAEGTRSIDNSPAVHPDRPTAIIEGTVRVRGNVPPLPPLKTSAAVEKVCGARIPDRTLIVGEAGGLANAIVILADAVSSPEGGNSPRQPELVDQRHCEYVPPVLALRAGAEIEIRNSDPLLHNVRAKNSSPLFNFAMPVQGLKVRKQLPRSPLIIHLACDVHPWMHAVIRTFDHPFFAITDAHGRYRMPDVPSGEQKLVFWHQRFPEKTIQVHALPSRPNPVDLAWPASELRL
jgi:hypothetical protein